MKVRDKSFRSIIIIVGVVYLIQKLTVSKFTGNMKISIPMDENPRVEWGFKEEISPFLVSNCSDFSYLSSLSEVFLSL